MQAVIFDVDGTLLDVREGLHWQYQQLTAHYDGATATPEAIISALRHQSAEDTVRELIKNNKIPLPEIMEHHKRLGQHAYRQFVVPHRGVEELLPILRRMNVRTAAITGDSDFAAARMHSAGLYHLLDVVVTADDMTYDVRRKHGIEVALERLALEPDQVLIISDATSDMIAAREYGIAKRVAITHGVGHIEALRTAGATHIIHDIPSLLDVLW